MSGTKSPYARKTGMSKVKQTIVRFGIIGSLLLSMSTQVLAAPSCSWKVNGANLQFCVQGLSNPITTPIKILCQNQNCQSLNSDRPTSLPIATQNFTDLGGFSSCTSMTDQAKKDITWDNAMDCAGKSPIADCLNAHQLSIRGHIDGICDADTTVVTSPDLSLNIPGQGTTAPVFSPPPQNTQPANTNPVKNGPPVDATNPLCSDGKSVNTAIGCINVNDAGGLLKGFMGLFLGVAGGVAFLIIVLGGMKVTMSGGNPKVVSEGQELITSAVVGLLMVIFSVFLLRLIGFDIMGIPGFS